jgi:hypothetical protein
MPHFHGGGFHGGRGARFFGGGYGGYGDGYLPIVPVIIESPPDDKNDGDGDGDDGAPPTTTVGYARGSRFFQHGGVGDRLVDVAKVMIPAPTRVELATELLGTHLAVVACVDGKCYRGVADLSGILAEIEPELIARARELHAQFHDESDTAFPPRHSPLVGGAPLIGAEAVIGAIQSRVNLAGEALVGALLTQHHAEICAGWWHNLTHKIKSDVEGVTHDIAHPNELAHDIAHYALKPSDFIKKTAEDFGAGAGLAKAISYGVDPLQIATENPAVQQAVATMYGGPLGAAAFKAAQGLDTGGQTLAQTLQQAAPQIAAAASNAAGAAGGPAAASLAGALVNAAAGTGNLSQVAQQAVSAASAAAANDPTAKAALDIAHQAVAQATAAQHVASTIQSAAAGNQGAKDQVLELTTAAAQGDAAAQGVVQAAQNMATQAQDLGDAASDAASDATVSGWPAVLLASGLGFGAGRWGGDLIERGKQAWAAHAAKVRS